MGARSGSGSSSGVARRYSSGGDSDEAMEYVAVGTRHEPLDDETQSDYDSFGEYLNDGSGEDMEEDLDESSEEEGSVSTSSTLRAERAAIPARKCRRLGLPPEEVSDVESYADEVSDDADKGKGKHKGKQKGMSTKDKATYKGKNEGKGKAPGKGKYKDKQIADTSTSKGSHTGGEARRAEEAQTAEEARKTQEPSGLLRPRTRLLGLRQQLEAGGHHSV